MANPAHNKKGVYYNMRQRVWALIISAFACIIYAKCRSPRHGYSVRKFFEVIVDHALGSILIVGRFSWDYFGDHLISVLRHAGSSISFFSHQGKNLLPPPWTKEGRSGLQSLGLLRSLSPWFLQTIFSGDVASRIIMKSPILQTWAEGVCGCHKIILKGILTRMELDGTEEILLESFNYLSLLLKDRLRFSTGD